MDIYRNALPKSDLAVIEDFEKILGRKMREYDDENAIRREREEPMAIGEDHEYKGGSDGVFDLDLDYLDLQYLPDSIGQLKNLRILKIRNNLLTSLPDSIQNLPNLKMLWARGNKLLEIPKWLKNCPLLDSLDFSDNKITEIPIELCEIPNISGILLNNNNINHIPRKLLEIPTLSNLELKGNPIENKGEILKYQRQGLRIMLD